MQVIYKYEVIIKDIFTLDIPLGARVLSLQVQRGKPYMWIQVNSDVLVVETRVFWVLGTGHPFPDEVSLYFLGTFQIHSGNSVFHVFEQIGDGNLMMGMAIKG